MKAARSLLVSVWVLAMFLALSEKGARGEVPYVTHMAGTFTLPFEVQWGAMTLPAGDYTLKYGAQENGHGLVVVRGTAKGSPYGMIPTGPFGQTSATTNSILCIREGSKGYVRELRMGAIGESVRFELPHGVEVEARILRSKVDHNATTQLAEMRISIAPAPVK